MIANMDRLMSAGCLADNKEKLCRSKGGESCAFDGAMIVLQPIADAAHIVHGPIACCGNSWEGRGSHSATGGLHKMGFTTDMSEMDIIYGSETKLRNAIYRVHRAVRPRAIFVYATCVSGLTGEDIEAVCRDAAEGLDIPVIPVNAPGFVGPKNLGNRIAGEALLRHVIGRGEPGSSTDCDVNLIGEYNIAGDLGLVEPLLEKAGVRVLSRITGNATFDEITYAHRARLNVVVCSRAMINVAKEMKHMYGIPYIEVSFFGKTEMSKALRAIISNLKVDRRKLIETSEMISGEEKLLESRLSEYAHLRGKKAVLYTGGVKSWSFISALLDLGIEVSAVGTKKSTVEDEEKMRWILGDGAPLFPDTTPGNLLRLISEHRADILVAGGRNQYLAIKEGIPFVDVNQERHTAYAGYEGLVNLAEQISRGIRFYNGDSTRVMAKKGMKAPVHPSGDNVRRGDVVINPLKHSQSIGAAVAFQGVHKALPVIHGAQGCNFLAKVLLTKHFREPIALVSTKLFTEDVVMGSEGRITQTVEGLMSKGAPDVVGILTSGLSEIKGDDVRAAVKALNGCMGPSRILHVSTPDYEGGLEEGYAKAVEALLGIAGTSGAVGGNRPLQRTPKQINVLAGSHLTPADFTEMRTIIESFGLKPIILPDLSALDGSREGFSSVAEGGTRIEEIGLMAFSEFTLAIGASMEQPAEYLRERTGVEYKVLDSIAGLNDTDAFIDILSALSNAPAPSCLKRQRRILIDGMRDAHFHLVGKRVCLALETDLAIQTSRWLAEMWAAPKLAILPLDGPASGRVQADEVRAGDLYHIEGRYDVMISNSHAGGTAERLGVPLYQTGFPVFDVLGSTSAVTVGYRGTLASINGLGNILAKEAHR